MTLKKKIEIDSSSVNQINKNVLVETMKECINIITNLSSDTASLNFCLYDGTTLICTRYINSEDENPPSLYYINNFTINKNYKQNVIISSEPISKKESDWRLVPKNSLLILDCDNKVKISKIH